MDEYILKKAEDRFKKLYKRAHIKSFNKTSSALPTLEILKNEVPIESESYSGTKDIEVSKIIGTENRENDFCLGFLPKNKYIKKRWLVIYELLNSARLPESIKVLKYGGYYFVRDGNHRVSVAKDSGIEYITADVIEYKVSVKLPKIFNMSKLSVFKEKYELHKRTNLFNYVNEDDFDVRLSETWSMIEKEIFYYNKAWYLRQYNSEPPSTEDLIVNWNKGLYLKIISHIEKHSLLYLYPGFGLTDIFIEFIKYWNSFDNPDEFWVEEAYANFTKKIQKRRFYLVLIQTAAETMSSLLRSETDDRNYLESITLLSSIRPSFKLPSSSKIFYRYLYKQIAVNHALMLKKRKKRPPYFQEVIIDWFDNYYEPIYSKYSSLSNKKDFIKYFKKFSKSYYFKIFYRDYSINRALDEY